MIAWTSMDERERLVWSATFAAHFQFGHKVNEAVTVADMAVQALRAYDPEEVKDGGALLQHDKVVRAIRLLDEMSIKDIDREKADAIYLELHQVRRALQRRAQS